MKNGTNTPSSSSSTTSTTVNTAAVVAATKPQHHHPRQSSTPNHNHKNPIPPFVVMHRPIELDRLDERYEYHCSSYDCVVDENDDDGVPNVNHNEETNEPPLRTSQHSRPSNGIQFHYPPLLLPSSYHHRHIHHNHHHHHRSHHHQRTTPSSLPPQHHSSRRRRNDSSPHTTTTTTAAVSTAKLLWSVTSTTAGMLLALQLVLHLFLRPNDAMVATTTTTTNTRTSTSTHYYYPHRMLVSALVVSNVVLPSSSSRTTSLSSSIIGGRGGGLDRNTRPLSFRLWWDEEGGEEGVDLRDDSIRTPLHRSRSPRPRHRRDYGGSQIRTSSVSLSSSPISNAESSSSSSSSSPTTKTTNTTQSNYYYIREAVYSDLNAVAHILIHSFYSDSSALLRPYLYLSELSRLQGNFPYGGMDVPHRFYVAVAKPQPQQPPTSSSESKDTNPFVFSKKPKPKPNKPNEEEIIGFVDIDARFPTKNHHRSNAIPPRPYLSDLAVKPSHRRCGIAKSLVQRCEQEVVHPSFRRVLLQQCQEEGDDGSSSSSGGNHNCGWDVPSSPPIMNMDELYLRVEKTNEGALRMYGSLGYDVVPHGYFGVRDTTLLLRRGLGLVDDDDEKTTDDDEDEDSIRGSSSRNGGGNGGNGETSRMAKGKTSSTSFTTPSITAAAATKTKTTTTSTSTSKAATAIPTSTMDRDTKTVSTDMKASTTTTTTTTVPNAFAEKGMDGTNGDDDAAFGVEEGDVTGRLMTDRQTSYGVYCIDYVI